MIRDDVLRKKLERVAKGVEGVFDAEVDVHVEESAAGCDRTIVDVKAAVHDPCMKVKFNILPSAKPEPVQMATPSWERGPSVRVADKVFLAWAGSTVCAMSAMAPLPSMSDKFDDRGLIDPVQVKPILEDCDE